MANDNKTVEQVCEELRQFKDCDGDYVREIEDLADEAEAAHKREIDAYELELDRWFHLGLKDSAEVKALRTKNERLRTLIKELADALDSLTCHSNCDVSHDDLCDDDCFHVKNRALVTKARKVCK